MDYLITFLALAGFGYFIYTKVRASKARKEERVVQPAEPRDRDEDHPYDDRFDRR